MKIINDVNVSNCDFAGVCDTCVAAIGGVQSIKCKDHPNCDYKKLQRLIEVIRLYNLELDGTDLQTGKFSWDRCLKDIFDRHIKIIQDLKQKNEEMKKCLKNVISS